MRYFEPIDKEKTHYVAWSGGCDSSLLLYKVCSELKGTSSTVTALISEPWFISNNKSGSESLSRDLFERELWKRNLNFGNMTIKTTIYQNNKVVMGGENCYAQAGMWVLEFLALVKDNSVIHFGYIKGDDFWHFDNDFLTMVKQYSKMLGKNIDVKFDLGWYTKADVLQELRELNLEDKTWFCETPRVVGEPCGCCVPCRTHLSSMLEKFVQDFEDFDSLLKFAEENKKTKESLALTFVEEPTKESISSEELNNTDNISN